MKREKVSKSPTPKNKKAKIVVLKKQGFTFLEAVEVLIAGEKITRLEWKNEGICFLDTSGRLLLHKLDGKDYDWVIRKEDLIAKDWVIKI